MDSLGRIEVDSSLDPRMTLPRLSHQIDTILRRCAFFALLLALTGASLLAADTPEIIPLDQIKPGMIGEARTIFSGDEVEKFELVVIGVLPNLMGPRQSIILVQLKGAKVEHTGVVAGMSGSPVYINGKLAGALSLKFGAFTKEPIGGVTPIQDILSLPTGDSVPGKGPASGPAAAARAGSIPSLNEAPTGTQQVSAQLRYDMPANWPQSSSALPANAYLQPIGTPLVFSGFSPATLRQYAGEWNAYGMVATPGGTAEPQADDQKITPGDMISMVMVQGDLSMNSACTVTAIVEDRVYASAWLWCRAIFR
jgi:hypothetical protein